MKHRSRLCQFEVKLQAIPAAGWRAAPAHGFMPVSHGAITNTKFYICSLYDFVLSNEITKIRIIFLYNHIEHIM